MLKVLVPEVSTDAMFHVEHNLTTKENRRAACSRSTCPTWNILLWQVHTTTIRPRLGVRCVFVFYSAQSLMPRAIAIRIGQRSMPEQVFPTC